MFIFIELNKGAFHLLDKFFCTYFIKEFFYSYTRYKLWLHGIFDRIMVLFVFFSVVLAAMQVRVNLPQTRESKTFLGTLYRFVVSSILVANISLTSALRITVMYTALDIV